MTAPTIELACLDMAGTTVSDAGAVEAAFTEAMTVVGIAPGSRRFDNALEYVRTTMGQSKITVFTAVLGNDADAARANAAFEAAYGKNLETTGVTPIAGAREAIDRLRDAGTKVCLTTGFSPTTRDAIVDALSWHDAVDLVLSPSDAGRGRPFPDMIWRAAIVCETSAISAVAVAGDTTSDLLAGSRSGARVVAGVLTGAHDRASLMTAPHTHILQSVASLPDALAALER